jgi:hypothetical protein
MRLLPHCSNNGYYQKILKITSADENVGKRTLANCWKECTLIQPL